MKRILLALSAHVLVCLMLSSCAGTATSTQIAASSAPASSMATDSTSQPSSTETVVSDLTAFIDTSSEDISSLLAQASSDTASLTSIPPRGVIKKVVKKKKTSSVTTSSTPVSSTPPTSSVVEQKAVTILPIGETTTQGGYPDADTSAYRQALYQMYLSAGLSTRYVGTQSTYDGEMTDGNVKHSAYGGATVQKLLEEHLPAILQCETPDVILLMIGRNDLGQGTPVETYIIGMNTLLDGLQNAFPEAEIFVGSVPPCRHYEGQKSLYETELEKSYYTSLKAMVETRSQSEPVHFVDMSADSIGLTWENYENASDNYVYPNAEGYQKIAGAWCGATISTVQEKAK